MRSSRRSTAALAVVLLMLAGPACATRGAGPRPEPAETRPTASARLASDVESLFTASPADRVLWGVLVRAADGPVIYQRDASRLLHPASNMKLLTLAAAAERLGWDFRFETTVRATTPIEAGGVVRGDLVVVGSGDPTISRRHNGTATLSAWADRLWQLGVRRIDGRVIGDGSAFAGTTFGDGWQVDDLPFAYAAPINALSYNENTAELVIGPGDSDGALASVVLVDRVANLTLRSLIRTTAAGSARRLSLERALDGARATLRGEVPLGYAPFKQYLTVPDPPAYFARAFRAALVTRGIAVSGGARSADTDPPGPYPLDAPVLVRHLSPPLREMAVTLMKVSQNLYAELLLHALASASGGRPSETLSQSLAGWGVSSDAAVAADGSGLSRYGLVSALTVDAVLSRMFDPAHRTPWVASLPVAGVDGTLQRRMKGTPAEGRVFAKTGSLAYVRALAGYAQRLDGSWIQFVILANNFAGTVTAADVDRITDQAVNLLVTSRPQDAPGTRH